MNVRVKLANKEPKTCSKQISEHSSDHGRSNAVVDVVANRTLLDNVEDNLEASENLSAAQDSGTNVEKTINAQVKCKVAADNSSKINMIVIKHSLTDEYKNDVKQTADEEHSSEEAHCSEEVHCSEEEHCSEEVHCSEQKHCSEEERCLEEEHCSEEGHCSEKDELNEVKQPTTSLEEESSNEENISNENTDKEESSSDSDDKESEKSNLSSKLDAEALSASLSSSKFLLKRNRDDLDDDYDSCDDKEEPISKKSNVEVTPKHVSKLKSSELLASMSSSKSLLKRGIEKVEKANREETTDAPESKKSNLTQTFKREEESLEHQKELRNEDSSKDLKTPEKVSLKRANIAAPKILNFTKSPCRHFPADLVSFCVPTPSGKIPEKCVHTAKEEPVKEEVRQKIGAKELAGQRQLERKRLNKMLAIFDDQKIVK